MACAEAQQARPSVSSHGLTVIYDAQAIPWFSFLARHLEVC